MVQDGEFVSLLFAFEREIGRERALTLVAPLSGEEMEYLSCPVSTSRLSRSMLEGLMAIG